MFNNCQDAMGICKRFGYPDVFIIVTCDAKWPEIHNFPLPKGLQPYDRPDIVCRVFKMKLDEMMTDLKKKTNIWQGYNRYFSLSINCINVFKDYLLKLFDLKICQVMVIFIML
jgi:hypothetical protein